MHAGVFGARISEEAFKTLLDVMQSNFAALTLPDENQVISSKSNSNKENRIVIITRENNNISLRVSRIIKNPRSREISGVIEIAFPIFANPWPHTSTMKQVKSPGDEPMEIEEITLPETPTVDEDQFFGEIDDEKGGKPRPKAILRKSKVAKIFDAPKTPVPEPEEKEASSEIQKTKPKSKLRPLVKKEDKDPKDTEGPKAILRKSKLAKIFDAPKTPVPEPEEKEASSEIQKTKPKSKLRPLVKKEDKDPKDTEGPGFFYFWQMMFFVLFPIAIVVACVSMTREGFDATKCAIFDPTPAIRDLENRVFGQTTAIRELRSHLSSNPGRFKVIALIGGAGVGKSYAAHIIGENFTPKKNVFQYVPPLGERRRYAAGAASGCGCNLIILENLGNKDILEAANFVDYLAGKIAEKYCAIVIQVINVQETDDNLRREVNLTKSTEDIESVYREKKLGVKIVKFEPLDDRVLDKCIIDAAKSRNLTLSLSDIDDVRLSLKNAGTGCKGARAKVQLLDNN